MAYDEGLATRLRDYLEDRTPYSEKRMFGGLCFLIEGNMCFGIVADDLLARVGPDAYTEALKQPGARHMDFTGRPMKGMVFVAASAISEDDDLRAWLDRCLGFCLTLPSK